MDILIKQILQMPCGKDRGEMLSANKTKLFFIFILAVFLITCFIEVKINTLQFQSSQLSNFLISKNAIKFMTNDRAVLTKKKLDDLTERHPKVAVMTFQNMASYRCIGFYSKNLDMFEEYMISGRFFREDELREGAPKAIVGEDLFYSRNKYVAIQKKPAKTYAVIGGVTFEVIGVIGGKDSSSLDNLVIVSVLNLNNGMYYLDSKSTFSNNNAFYYAKQTFSAREMEDQSTILNAVIHADMQFDILKIIQVCIKLLLLTVLIYLAYKISCNMIYVHYLMGFPLWTTIKESCQNILACSLAVLLVVLFMVEMQLCSLSECFYILSKYWGGIAVVLLATSLICLKVYYIRNPNSRLNIN